MKRFGGFRAIVLSGMLAVGLLGGCQDKPVEPSAEDLQRAEQARPTDLRLAAIYDRSCVTCHGTRSAAPLAGFEPAWRPRLKQGPQVLLQHAREGFNGMPAKGLCADCTDDDLQALIAFMSSSHGN
ncbi:MAG: c-type cytochrome [Aquabacterium sp.]|uniref:c-type cytochrome n=1 Tax=Aquabacterium sp. TaxID=1872578 RepID=UPI003BDD8BDC